MSKPNPHPTTHKAVGTIENTISFDSQQHGPIHSRMTTVVALTASHAYPRTRITLCTSVANLCLTVHQAKDLRDQLDSAIVEVITACPALVTPDDMEMPTVVARG